LVPIATGIVNIRINIRTNSRIYIRIRVGDSVRVGHIAQVVAIAIPMMTIGSGPK
jgi:hypothetical protein